MNVKNCNNCFLGLDWSAFTLRSDGKPRSTCKKCRSEIENNRFIEKQVGKAPNMYRQCEECCAFYRKTKNHVCKND